MDAKSMSSKSQIAKVHASHASVRGTNLLFKVAATAALFVAGCSKPPEEPNATLPAPPPATAVVETPPEAVATPKPTPTGSPVRLVGTVIERNSRCGLLVRCVEGTFTVAGVMEKGL